MTAGQTARTPARPATIRPRPTHAKGLPALVRGQLAPRVALFKPLSIGLIAERAAEQHGRVPIYVDRPFDWDPDGRTELDYVEFAAMIEDMSAMLREAGVRPWDRVAIVKSPNFDVQALTYAVARLGAIPAPLSAHLDGEILTVLLDRLRSPFLVTDQPTVDAAGLDAARLKKMANRVIGPVEGGIPLDDLRGARIPDATPRQGDEPVLITHTSSTTGVSKLVETTVGAVTYSSLVESGAPFGHGVHELNATCISFVHVRSSITQMAALSRGTSLLAIGQPDDETVVRLFSKYKPTLTEAHPNTFVRWEQLADAPGEPFSDIRIFFSTFDATHPRTITRLLQASRRKAPVWIQCYGQSETQVVTIRVYSRGSTKRLERRGTKSRSLGWPVPGVRVRIYDPKTGRRAARGQAGQIQVRTPGMARSFVGTPEKYWSRRFGKWIDTGDWGRKGTWGDVEVHDRVADRIEGIDSCLWIEDVLLTGLPNAGEVVVVPDAEGRPVPVVSMRDGVPLDPETWRAACRDLPPLGEPFFVSEEELKRTATAKARRYLLSEMVKARHAGGSDGAIAPDVLLRDGA